MDRGFATLWQVGLRVLVAPFYVGLFLITAVGSLFAKRT
jgi:hypothetical protein